MWKEERIRRDHYKCRTPHQVGESSNLLNLQLREKKKKAEWIGVNKNVLSGPSTYIMATSLMQDDLFIKKKLST